MIRKHIQPWNDWLRRVVSEPRHELNRWQASVRFAYDLGVHGWKALNRDNATEMAAALAFRTLFALLPVIIVSTVLVRAFGGPDQFISIFRGVIGALGMYEVRLVAANEAVNSDQPQTLGEWTENLIGNVANYNLEAIGWLGLALVIYAAIGLVVTIENSFNKIYGAPEGRGWTRRIPTYWAVLTIGPAFVGLMLYLNTRFGNWIQGVDTWKWLLNTVQVVWGFVVAWLFMFGVYRLVPNTKVASKAALVGSFITAILLVIGKSSLDAYFASAVSFQSLFGSLSAAPVFMFWVYLMWLVVLFGLEVAATIQMLHGRPLEELEEKRPQNGLVDPAAILPVMEIITERFANAQPATTREIADQTLIAESIVCRIVDRLVQSGYLHRVEGPDSAVALARPPEMIPADLLIELGYSLVDEGGVGRQSALLPRLREAQKNLAHHITLASLLRPNGQNSVPSQPVTLPLRDSAPSAR